MDTHGAETADAGIRLATQAELPRLRDIIYAAYSKYLPRMDRPPAPMLRDLRPDIMAGHVWASGDPATGLISLEASGEAVHIGNLAVHPDAQGAGLGRRLMDFTELQARRLGLRHLRLYTNEVMTENLAIYAHLGYHEVGRHADDGYRRIFMEKALPRISN